MDPSETLCRVHDSFSGPPPAPSDPVAWTSFGAVAPRADIVPASRAPAPTFAPPGYAELQELRGRFSVPSQQPFRDAVFQCDPFSAEASKAEHRFSPRMANLDAIFGITPRLFDTLNKQFTLAEEYTFADVAGGPGGFAKYVQYRYPNAKGAGITLKSEAYAKLDTARFSAWYGPRGKEQTGDLYDYCEEFQQYLVDEFGGVDLLMANGGDLPTVNHVKSESDREHASSRLLGIQVYLGISCVLKGGNFVLKMSDTVTRHSVELLYLASMCFDKVAIVKPVAVPMANSVRYAVFKGRRDEDAVGPIADILFDALPLYKAGSLESLLEEGQISDSFRAWIDRSNALACQMQTDAAERVLRYMAGDKSAASHRPAYSSHKLFGIWNI